MNETSSPPAKRTKPIIWAGVLLTFTSIFGTLLLFSGGGDYLSYGFTPACVAAAFALVFFPRSPRTYTLCAVVLAFFVLRAGYTTSVIAYRLLTDRHSPGGWYEFMVTAWTGYLVFLLFRSYTFGAPTRQFYGFPIIPNSRKA